MLEDSFILLAIADRTMTKLDNRIARNRKDLDRLPPGDTSRAIALDNLAISLFDRFTDTNDVADLDEVITLGRSVLDLRPASHPHRHISLHLLGYYLWLRYCKQSTLSDLRDAIMLAKAALDLRPAGHPNRSDSLHNLAAYLSNKYDKQATTADLQEAITLGRAALELRPIGDPGRVMTLHNLGNDLQHRFLKFGANADLEEAISLHQSVLDVHTPGHPDRSESLYTLATCFKYKYDKQATIADLQEAITLGRAALELRPLGHPSRAVTLNNLGIYLWCRLLKLGANTDLEEAISMHRSALDLRPVGHPDRSDSLHELAVCFSSRHEKLAIMKDLQDAITLGRSALELRPSGHSYRDSTLNNLGVYLKNRFLKLEMDADLEEAILMHQSALDLRPTGHPDRPISLNQLASCLSFRFDKLDAETDLNDLIILHRAIFDLHPQGHHGRVESIDKLLLYLRKRIRRLGIPADMDECITMGHLALALRKSGDLDHATCLYDLVTDFHNRLHILASTFDIKGSSDNVTSLRNLVICVRDVVDEGHVSTAHVDEIVAIARAASGLYPSDHPDRVVSLTTLATCLRHKFQQQDDITDLHEAIDLYEEVSERCPSESPDSAPLLHQLAWCLSERFIKLSTRADLDNAIKVEQAASALFPPGHPDHTRSLNSLATYLQMRIEGKGAALQPARPACLYGSPQVKQLISDVVFETLKAFPPRLLCTRNGTLCDRDSQILHFENSQEYKQLVSSALAFDTLPQSSHIRAVVSTHFQYVSLSHRWGIFEPLLHDIEKQVVYDLDPTHGLSKLQSFCLASCRQGYLWAWSDTCCIDKDSSAELQEAIGSMFLWYRQSALTIVHLADVSETGKLTSSVWFKRGWTLQELLAPHTLLFFTQNWLLYQNVSLNHKQDIAILGELEQATGIARRHLTDFHPGVDDARSRLQWASTRCTTRPEDIAYSLFGVFGFHIPVLYGESAENALGRLLSEVISKSGDTSILDWVGQSSTFHSCFPATITPYQTPPPQPLSPDSVTLPSMRGVRNLCTRRHVRKIHGMLSNLPPTQFVNGRLFLPCIVYRIKSIVLTRVDASTGNHVHRIQAMGLEPIEIALPQPLENILLRKAVPYALIRRHSELLDASVMTDDASTYRWLAKMQQPFSALLLKGLPQNEYKRVASVCHILACPTSYKAGALKGEVNTLTIV